MNRFLAYSLGVWTGLFLGYVATSYLADRVWVKRLERSHAAGLIRGAR